MSALVEDGWAARSSASAPHCCDNERPTCSDRPMAPMALDAPDCTVKSLHFHGTQINGATNSSAQDVTPLATPAPPAYRSAELGLLGQHPWRPTCSTPSGSNSERRKLNSAAAGCVILRCSAPSL